MGIADFGLRSEVGAGQSAIRHPPSTVAGLLLSVLLSPPVLAQQPVTRAEAIEAALTRGPRAALARADSAAARADLSIARAFQNPVASASYSKSTPQYHAVLDVPLELPWLRASRVGAARAATSSALYRAAFERASARFDAEVAYTRALAARDRGRLTRRTAEDADSLRKMAVLRRDAGDASDLDVELATVNAGQVANDAASDSVAALATLLDLQAVMGLPADRVAVALADSLAPPVPGEAPAGSMPLQVVAAEAALTAGERALALEQRSVFAAPSVQLGFETRDPTGAEPGLLPTIGIALPLPLLNQNRGAIALAAARRDRARVELEVTRRESAADLARAIRERAAALDRATRDRALVTSANRVAALSLTAYTEGAAGLPAVLEATRNAREALARYVDDVAATNLADAALRLFTAGSAP